MSEATFRAALQALLQAAAESGLDLFWLHHEVSLATAALIDECRVELAEVDESEKAPW